jgi:hypothetical protein
MHHTGVPVLHTRRYGRRQPGWIYTSAEIPALPAGCPGWLSEVVLGLLRSDHCDEERRLTPAEGVAMLEVCGGDLCLASENDAAVVLYVDPALNLRLTAARRWMEWRDSGWRGRRQSKRFRQRRRRARDPRLR